MRCNSRLRHRFQSGDVFVSQRRARETSMARQARPPEWIGVSRAAIKCHRANPHHQQKRQTSQEEAWIDIALEAGVLSNWHTPEHGYRIAAHQ